MVNVTDRAQEILDGKGVARPARLFPGFKDSQRELRAVSSVLAVLSMVPDFARDLLAVAGHSVRKTSKVECVTEITLKNDKDKSRPDGLITVTTQKRPWHAFVEAKVGKEELGKEQIEKYLRLARENDVDAVITLSNQFCLHPEYHPVDVNKNLLRSTKLYHISWTGLLVIAKICAINNRVGDKEQAYMLEELIHFLQSDYSGVEGFTKMPTEWTQVCDAVRKSTDLNENSPMVITVADAWRELIRALSLHMSGELNVHIESILTKEQKKGHEKIRAVDCSNLCEENALQARLSIPHAASPVDIDVNLLGRTIVFSMETRAPKDRKRATASFTWILKQLKKCTDDNIRIAARWLGGKSFESSLGVLRGDKDSWSGKLPSNSPPLAFEVKLVRECGQNFTRQKNFVQETRDAFRYFYEEVGQHIESWRPKPPHLEDRESPPKNKDSEETMNQPPAHSDESVGVSVPGDAQIYE